jgi:hypothetical protein
MTIPCFPLIHCSEKLFRLATSIAARCRQVISRSALEPVDGSSLDAVRSGISHCELMPSEETALETASIRQVTSTRRRTRELLSENKMTSASLTEDGIVVEVGGLPILLRSDNAAFREMLEQRYSGFVSASSAPEFELQIELRDSPMPSNPDAEAEVRRENGKWVIQRGDFLAMCETKSATGRVVQSANPYAIDSVLRIVHTLIMAPRGGFLLHAASAIRNGRAFLFAGVSGAGKTTISRLAPPDVTLLTDEISFIRQDGEGYRACGTPFAGELAKLGENVSAPLSAVFLLEKGLSHRTERVERSEALGALLRNILFFAHDPELVKLVFHSAARFVDKVPVHRLIFAPEQSVWELIG